MIAVGFSRELSPAANPFTEETMEVYLITNNITKKQYIGQTVKALKTRWSEHKSPAAITRFSRSIKKYGAENFTMESLHVCETKEEMDFVEMFYIAFLNTKTPNGYNLTDGGEGTHGMSPSSETREKMRLAKLGKKQTSEHIASRVKGRLEGNHWHKHTDETKKLISEKLTGAGNANFGKPKSDSTKKLMSEANCKAKPWHHGTGTAYQKYKCRCSLCLEWYSKHLEITKENSRKRTKWLAVRTKSWIMGASWCG
jgi:group I intron endonuclease